MVVTKPSLGETVRQLPPLILHPFSERSSPESLLENSRAALILSGLLPGEGEDYELLFTVPKNTAVPFQFEDIRLTRIGTMQKGIPGAVALNGETRTMPALCAAALSDSALTRLS